MAFMDCARKGGKPLNLTDFKRAYAVWRGMELDFRNPAFEAFEALCIRTAPAFIPHPANFLLSQAWTRIATPRVYPMPSREPEYESEEETIRRFASL
jgi:hypothetical protein